MSEPLLNRVIEAIDALAVVSSMNHLVFMSTSSPGLDGEATEAIATVTDQITSRLLQIREMLEAIQEDLGQAVDKSNCGEN